MALPNIRGSVAHVFGADFDVDQIVGVENIKIQDLQRLTALALERLGPDFVARMKPGDVLVAGANFGYGHPHFPAMRALRHLGIRAVIAESFFPNYWRGEISNGFPQIACSGITERVQPGDPIEIDFAALRVRLPRHGQLLSFPAFAPSDLAILEAGGFRPWLAQSIAIEHGQKDPPP